MSMLATWLDFFANVAQVFLLILGLFLILVVLLQRGRGGGLAGAFGGAGGQSAFGTKAGDVFTKITIGIAVLWVVTNGVSGMLIRNSQSAISDSFEEQGDDGQGDTRLDQGTGSDIPEADDLGGTGDGTSPFIFPDADTMDDGSGTTTEPEGTDDDATTETTTPETSAPMTDAVETEDETDTTTPAPEEGTETPPMTDEADTTVPESPGEPTTETPTETEGATTESDATGDGAAADPSN